VAKWGRASRGPSRAAAVGAATLALILGGCSAFLGPGAFGDDLPSSSPIATYSTGKATIAIKDGETIELGQVAEGSGVDSLFGSDVHWTGPSGWHLRVSGAGGNEGFGFEGGYINLDRITEGQHWTTQFDGSRCITDVTVVDATAIRGSATCKGVQWYDALDMTFTRGEPKKIDEPKFDAEITFEALP
jgi:hypothetical protein